MLELCHLVSDICSSVIGSTGLRELAVLSASAGFTKGSPPKRGAIAVVSAQAIGTLLFGVGDALAFA